MIDSLFPRIYNYPYRDKGILAFGQWGETPKTGCRGGEDSLKTKDLSYKVHVPMDKELIQWLENVGIEAKESGGFKLAKSVIIRACVRSVMKLPTLDLTGVKDEHVLTKRITKLMKKY